MKSTKTKRKLNVGLLRRIKKHILEEPRRFVMRTYVIKGRPGSAICDDLYAEAQEIPECGTVACIAGWATILGKARVRKNIYGDVNYWTPAKRLLGLTTKQSNMLFSQLMWPSPFFARYRHSLTPQKRVKVAAERIEHLIKTGE